MKTRRSIFAMVVALLLLLPSPAKAGYIYTISFNATPAYGLECPACVRHAIVNSYSTAS